jgi:hypothetical protein
MHTSRWIILAGSGVALVALFLPFLGAPLLGTVDGFEGDAWPAAALLAVPALAAVAGDRAEGFRRWVAVATIAVTDIAVVFAVFKLVDAYRAARTARAAADAGTVGAGPWVLAVGATIVLIGCLMSLSRKVR